MLAKGSPANVFSSALAGTCSGGYHPRGSAAASRHPARRDGDESSAAAAAFLDLEIGTALLDLEIGTIASPISAGNAANDARSASAAGRTPAWVLPSASIVAFISAYKQ